MRNKADEGDEVDKGENTSEEDSGQSSTKEVAEMWTTTRTRTCTWNTGYSDL